MVNRVSVRSFIFVVRSRGEISKRFSRLDFYCVGVRRGSIAQCRTVNKTRGKITGETQNGLSSFLPPGSCGIPVCEGDNEEDIKGASLINGQSVSGEEGVLLAGTSVFVLDPGQTPCKYRTVLFIPYHRFLLHLPDNTA